jgi:hypothetical protein
MTKHVFAIMVAGCLVACQSTPPAADTAAPSGPRPLAVERELERVLLQAEFRTLLEIQDSLRLMLMMGSSAIFGDRALVWTDEQNTKAGQLSTEIVGLLARYTMEITVRANDPIPMDPILFGQEVKKLGHRRAALWLELVETNNLPESTRSIFHHGMYPER